MSAEIATRRVERVRQEPRRRKARVLGVEPVGVNFLSVVLEGEDLADFNSPGFDDHVKFMFKDEHGVVQSRDITPRRFEPQKRRLTLEFAMHEGGAACQWARRALRDDEVEIGGPKGSVIVPTDYPWHLLAGDPTAAPAIARRLEELPADVRAYVFMLADDPDDRRVLASRAETHVEWTYDEEHLEAMLRDFELPEGEGFVWCAGEAALAARLRDLFVNEKQHPRHALRIAGYWKSDEAGYHETLEKAVD
jgi:NADPH-dependent ferric siderophore reductase